MSIIYYLDIATSLSLQEVIQVLFQKMNYRQEFPDNYGEVVINTEFFGAIARKVTREDYASSRHLGIEPTIQLYFPWLARRSDDNLGYDQLIKLTVDYLTQTQNDLALLFEGAIPLLLRRNGELIRNSAEGVWTPEGIKLITIPHKVEYIPNIQV